MGWTWEPDKDHDYRFLGTGELEFRDRNGSYRIVGGCSVVGRFEFEDRYQQLRDVALSAPESASISELWLAHSLFRYLCNRCLLLNGIEPDWVAPRQLDWLLFDRMEGEELIQAPLRILNTPPKPRHPEGASKADGPTDKIRLIAAIASHCGGNLDRAFELAKSQPMRDVLAAMDEAHWQRLPAEQKRKAEFGDWAKQMRAKVQRPAPVSKNGAAKPTLNPRPVRGQSPGGQRPLGRGVGRGR